MPTFDTFYNTNMEAEISSKLKTPEKGKKTNKIQTHKGYTVSQAAAKSGRHTHELIPEVVSWLCRKQPSIVPTSRSAK
jgi:hypothetical protein